MKIIHFNEFKQKLQEHVKKMYKGSLHLFTTDTDTDKLWDLYLDSFPAGTNEIFRERREHDCSCCRHFVKSFGSNVAIVDNKLVSIWDFDMAGTQYQPVIKAMAKYVKSKKVTDVFLTEEKSVGTDRNQERLEDKTVRTWDHLYVEIPKAHITISNKTIPSLQGGIKSTRNVFKRSLEEISLDSIETVLELIAQKSLYKGEEWEPALKKFMECHKEYHALKKNQKDNYCWLKSIKVGGAIAKIKNHSIGVLLADIDKMDLNDAVKRYEKIVAPSNYKRPKAIYTKKMIELAEKQIIELGFLESLGRRHANIDDITINNVLYLDRTKQKSLSVFEEMKQEAAVNPKNFDKVQEVYIEDFIRDIAPTAKNMELMLEGKHSANLMSLIAPAQKDTKTMFKWDNNFSWAYNGNITDSMKELVQAAGGDVKGVLRFSIKWNEEGNNNIDFDAHCLEPSGNRIYYGRKKNDRTSCKLDVDIVDPKGKVAVENITWTDINRMDEGSYTFLVNNYSTIGSSAGFSAEIEYDGEIHSYVYDKPLCGEEDVNVAKILFSKETGIRFISELPTSLSTKPVWGLNRNQFHKVNAVTMSPNYWDEQKGSGNKHYMFFLDKCLNPDTPNGFFNEFLKQDLMEHKKVFEALGKKMKVEASDNQLSGLGFSSTQGNSVFCKVEGSFKRVVKIIF